jgi:hypothetical protein
MARRPEGRGNSPKDKGTPGLWQGGTTRGSGDVRDETSFLCRQLKRVPDGDLIPGEDGATQAPSTQPVAGTGSRPTPLCLVRGAPRRPDASSR